MNAAKLLKAMAGAAISVLALIYLAVHFISGYGENTETVSLSEITVEDKLEARCYMLRDEVYITSGVRGVLHYTVDDGERVRKDQTVADVFANESDVSIQQQIRFIDRRIAILEDSAISDGYVTSSIAKMDNDILNTIISVKRYAGDDEYVRAFSFSDHLLTVLNKKRLVTKQEEGYEAEIARLEGLKQVLTGQMSQSMELVTTPYSGFFSTDLDGYEMLLTPNIVTHINVDDFFAILENSEKVPDNVIGKIITEYEWKILVLVDKKSAGEFTVGKRYDLCFPYSNDSRVPSALLDNKIIQTSSDTVLLSFSTLDIPEDFSYMREQTVEIVRSNAKGLRIPKNALRMIDGESGVYVLSGSTVRYKKVEILYTSDAFYLVRGTDAKEPLGIYDDVIVKGKDLYDGKVIS